MYLVIMGKFVFNNKKKKIAAYKSNRAFVVNIKYKCCL